MKLRLLRQAVNATMAVNGLYMARPPSTSLSSHRAHPELREVWGRFHSQALALSGEAIRRRRALGRTGVHALADLLRLEIERYTVKPKSIPQVPFTANEVDEPRSSVKVIMLEALPEEDAEFYSKPENLIDWNGKSQATMMEVEEMYGFLGGAQEEW